MYVAINGCKIYFIFFSEGITSAIKCVRNIESIKKVLDRRYMNISCSRDEILDENCGNSSFKLNLIRIST